MSSYKIDANVKCLPTVVNKRALFAAARLFTTMGLPGWLAYVVGGAELLGSIGLLLPTFTRFAATGLCIIMIGAIGMHAFLIPGGLMGGIPAMILLMLLTSLLWLRRLHNSGKFEVSLRHQYAVMNA